MANIPHLFICPISLDLFKDPVTLCTGQTYDRSSIEQWLGSGNLTCPVTMQHLHDPTIVPNHTLRGLINGWLRIGSNGYRFDPTIESLEVFKRSLETQETSFETKLQALQTLQHHLSEEELGEYSSSIRSCLVRLGFLPLLLELVFERAELSRDDDAKLVEQALSCFARLLVSSSDFECLNTLKEDPKLDSLSSLFERGNSSIKTSLCRIISTVSTSSKTRELCSKLGKTRKLLNEMAILIGQSSEASDIAIEALWDLSCSARNHEYLAREGVVDGLISYISSQRDERSFVPLAMSLLEKLLGFEAAREALLSNSNGIRSLVKRVFEVSNHEGSENAIGSLTIVCCGSLKAREEAVEAGVLTQLLLLLQSQCCGRTKTKARLLLKLLRSKLIQDPN